MPNQPPASRLQILEKGGRLLVIDRQTGLPPLSAAERMRQWDAQAGNSPPQFARLDDIDRPAKVENPFAAVQRPQRTTSLQAPKARPSPRVDGVNRASNGQRERPRLVPLEYITIFFLAGLVLIIVAAILGKASFMVMLAACIYAFRVGWLHRWVRQLTTLLESFESNDRR